jgi:hypothetical protein
MMQLIGALTAQATVCPPDFQLHAVSTRNLGNWSPPAATVTHTVACLARMARACPKVSDCFIDVGWRVIND